MYRFHLSERQSAKRTGNFKIEAPKRKRSWYKIKAAKRKLTMIFEAGAQLCLEYEIDSIKIEA